MCQQDQKYLLAKTVRKAQCKRTSKLLVPNMSDAFLNCVIPSLKSKEGQRVATVLAKCRHQIAIKNQTLQRLESSAGSCSRNTVIKVLLDVDLW